MHLSAPSHESEHLDLNSCRLLIRAGFLAFSGVGACSSTIIGEGGEGSSAGGELGGGELCGGELCGGELDSGELCGGGSNISE